MDLMGDIYNTIWMNFVTDSIDVTVQNLYLIIYWNAVYGEPITQ